MTIYKAIVIGCGSIGALKDDQYDFPKGSNILTHAHAFYEHPQIQFVGVVDTDAFKASKAGKKWGVCAMSSLQYTLTTYQPDIIAVCVPTEYHYQVLHEIAESPHRPRIVIAEKPFCSTVNEAIAIKNKYEMLNIPIIVNYTRRFSNIIMDVLTSIRDGVYGVIEHAHCLYGRGLLRDGCHGLDLFNFVFSGSPYHVSCSQSIQDTIFDPSKTLHLAYKQCSDIYMIAIDSRHFGMFELEFITHRGIVHLHDWGNYIAEYIASQELIYGQYKSMSRRNGVHYATDLHRALYNIADNAVEYLNGRVPIWCSPQNAIDVHDIISRS